MAEEQLLEPSFWEALCPELQITVHNSAHINSIPLPPQGVKELQDRMCTDGYFTVSAGQLRCQQLVTKLANSAAQLQAAGWPATFLALFDESWDLVAQLSALMLQTTGNRCNFDMVSWFVDADKGEGGFTPHRDRSFGSVEGETEETPLSFYPNGLPRYCTFWLALSEAQAENGCLYVVPAGVDPGYRRGDGMSLVSPNKLPETCWGLRASPSGQPVWSPNCNAAFRHVRALPCSAGELVCLSHRVLHWGSQGRKGNKIGPRISFSFAGSDHEQFERPYLKKKFRPALVSGASETPDQQQWTRPALRTRLA